MFSTKRSSSRYWLLRRSGSPSWFCASKFGFGRPDAAARRRQDIRQDDIAGIALNSRWLPPFLQCPRAGPSAQDLAKVVWKNRRQGLAYLLSRVAEQRPPSGRSCVHRGQNPATGCRDSLRFDPKSPGLSDLREPRPGRDRKHKSGFFRGILCCRRRTLPDENEQCEKQRVATGTQKPHSLTKQYKRRFQH